MLFNCSEYQTSSLLPFVSLHTCMCTYVNVHLTYLLKSPPLNTHTKEAIHVHQQTLQPASVHLKSHPGQIRIKLVKKWSYGRSKTLTYESKKILILQRWLQWNKCWKTSKYNFLHSVYCCSFKADWWAWKHIVVITDGRSHRDVICLVLKPWLWHFDRCHLVFLEPDVIVWRFRHIWMKAWSWGGAPHGPTTAPHALPW